MSYRNILRSGFQSKFRVGKAGYRAKPSADAAGLMEGNARELAMHFSEDAVVKFPQQEPLRGRQAVEQAHQQMIEKGIAVKPSTQEVQVSENLAFELGTYELVTQDGQQLDQRGGANPDGGSRCLHT